MKKIFTIVLILFISIEAYSQHSYLQDLRSEAQITFPDTPDVKFSDGVSYYVYKNNNCVYFASFTDLNRINKDSLNTKVPDSIFTQFISSTIKPLKGEIFYTKKIDAGNVKGIAFDYKCKINNYTYYGYQQAFHVNEALISYSLLSPDSLSRDDEKVKSFFTTFKLTPARAAILNKNSGFMTWIFLVGSIFFWAALVVYLIKRPTKKKSHEWPGG